MRILPDELVDEALMSILDPIKGGDNKPYLTPAPGSQLAVLINSLGATPPMELAVIGRRVVERPLVPKSSISEFYIVNRVGH